MRGSDLATGCVSVPGFAEHATPVIVEIAIEGFHRSVLHQPELVGASLQQITMETSITAPEKSLRASISAARLSMSRWLVGSSKMMRCGALKVASPEQSRLLAARQFLNLRIAGKS